MYGNGIGPVAGGIGGAGVLAATGSGGFILPLVIAILGLGLGALLIWRSAWMRRRAEFDGGSARTKS